MRRASRLRDDATRERGSPRRRASSDSECDVFSESGSASKRTRCRGGGCGEDVPGVDVSRERLAACGLRKAMSIGSPCIEIKRRRSIGSGRRATAHARAVRLIVE
ncbi:hypothetical protein BURPS1655_D1300 [Burkholderia pseudomallei 1655]|nr:hypothetical protein BURPS1655_D1300 [Burkholderia pseudomallei 1655]